MKQDNYDSLVAYILETQNKFYRLAYSYVRNQEDALDAVQNAVCKALEKSDTLRNQNAIKTWFYTILVNECLSILNTRKRNLLVKDDAGIEPIYIEEGYELHDDLHDKINQLDDFEQSIIRLRFFEEMSLDEISKIMNINVNTVKSRLYRGLKKLKLSVEEGE